MKLAAKIILSIAVVYVTIWIAMAAYFSFAAHHKDLLESNLTSLFKREVTIGRVETAWDGFSPSFVIDDLVVAGDSVQQAAFSFKNLTAKIDPVSILFFWPCFTQFAIEEPEVEIVNLSNGFLQIAGIQTKSNQSTGLNPKRVISWLLDNESATWHDGSIVWRRLNGEIDNFKEISFVYERQEQKRSIIATTRLPEGALAFKLRSQGDIINSNDWDASLEVLGDQGESYLGSDDLSLTVSEGEGRLLLKSLGAEKIRDFLQLTGIGGSQNWVLKSELSGELNQVEFNFSGPLLEFDDWSFNADAVDVEFKSTAGLPAMNNLNGSVEASSKGGVFNFETQTAEFSWQRWFDEPFPISEASGQFKWDLSNDKKINIELSDAVFSDNATSISNLNAKAEITVTQSRISNFADLFTINSVDDLSFEAGQVVDQKSNSLLSTPVFLDASADFNVPDIRLLQSYFPKDPRIKIFRQWWSNAILTGSTTDGHISYQGLLTKDALYNGNAQLHGSGIYKDVEIDYGYQRDWPLLSKGDGIITIDNTTLSFLSDRTMIGDDEVSRAEVSINSIFRKDRNLIIDAAMESSLPTVMNFLLDGPLIKKQENTNRTLPITCDQGDVDAAMVINIPLSDIKSATVAGSATVKNGRLWLPNDVPVSNISGFVKFTENSAESENIKGEFLGGEVAAALTTTQQAQPPVLKLDARGAANVSNLQPWIGEHLLSLINGRADWQGSLIVDGPAVDIQVDSNLQGVEIDAPAPLNKNRSDSFPLQLEMLVGTGVQQSLSVSLPNEIYVEFAGDQEKDNSLLNKSIISIGGDGRVKDGVNFDIRYDKLNLDDWIATIIEICEIKVPEASNTNFLDSMRSIKVNVDDPYFLGRQFGAMEMSAVSEDGGNWIGSITGNNIDGIIQFEPRAEIGKYRFNLSKLHIPKGPEIKPPLTPVNNTLSPDSYPIIDMSVTSFRLVRKQLGNLQMHGEPIDGAWKLTNFKLNHQGVSSSATGQWVNTPQQGTITSFELETVIDEAGGALQELDLGGLVSKGNGDLKARINWIGAPHEFDFSRLNGDFDLRVQDGELVKIEPGTGKLLGLLNFNAIARRMTLDFSDVFASGLTFDRMRYAGVFADGEAIMNEAYIFTPAVFVNMQGKLDLDKELIDMEIHLSPELGGNLTLLSALANPAAGALVFITQQLFKDEMRSNSYKSYRALGTWEDFEMVEFNINDDEEVN